MNLTDNQPSPGIIPLQTIEQMAGGTILSLAPAEPANDAPC